jgi:DNA-binding response OmpR family regulator
VKKKILIAEDGKALQMIYREELEEEGYEVCVANNGQEALNLLVLCPNIPQKGRLFDKIPFTAMGPSQDLHPLKMGFF